MWGLEGTAEPDSDVYKKIVHPLQVASETSEFIKAIYASSLYHTGPVLDASSYL